MEPYFILSRIRIPTVRLKSSIQGRYCPIIQKKRRDEMSRHASEDYLMNNAVEKTIFPPPFDQGEFVSSWAQVKCFF